MINEMAACRLGRPDSSHRDGAWRSRIHAIRANASCKSHEELDNSEELDVGNPEELGQQYEDMLGLMNHLNVIFKSQKW